MKNACQLCLCLIVSILTGQVIAEQPDASKNEPPPLPQPEPALVIYDTDMGGDIDDALALAMIHALADRDECKLLAVTITTDDPRVAPYIDAVNTFYGRPDTPIGMVRDGFKREKLVYQEIVQQKHDDQFVYPHDLLSGDDAPEAVGLLRQVLSAQPDQSVTIIQVGFSTNLARLLDTPMDEHSPLNGIDLVRQKVKLLSVMGGQFAPLNDRIGVKEFNIAKDIPAAQKLAADWPTPIVFSGYEVGEIIKFPWRSIVQDFDYVTDHPIADAYRAWSHHKPHDRSTWDLTSVLYAIRPQCDYFNLSLPGHARFNDEGQTIFTADIEGPHRYLMVTQDQVIRVCEAMMMLASQPPK
ncbi:MAG: nucleoside hydrolase [Phycisphaeraceae bacterium]|nr:nucleoside hydrolase [Phycisphaeraceae bacterium]